MSGVKPILQMKDLDLNNLGVLIRVDFNVPIKNQKVVSDARIRACLPTIELALKQNTKLMLMSHLGRPEEGVYDEEASLRPVAEHLSKLINKPVKLIQNWIDLAPEILISSLEPGEIVLLENVRFNKGEGKNDVALSKKMAAFCDVFVMDAFGTAHRAQASTYGVAKYAKVACAGPLLSAELEALSKALDNPKKPLTAIVGGSKVSTKLCILKNLVQKVDCLIVGGGIANTFLAAAGYPVGKSLYEPDLVDDAKEIMHIIQARGGQLPLPTDVVVSKDFSETAEGVIKSISEVAPDEMILDIGPKSTEVLAKLLLKSGTSLWNGPVGVFEFEAFRAGTLGIAHAIATAESFSIAGGGDTLSAIELFKIESKISYISTGGGAFLEFLEGKKLPAVEILEERFNK